MQPALVQYQFKTAFGDLVALADEQQLYLLAFSDQPNLHDKIKRLAQQTQLTIVKEKNEIIEHIEYEMTQYLAGKLQEFKTPIKLIGSPFQQSVWQTLQTIPYGQTYSFGTVANNINKPTAFRAVAQANGSNNLAIIIPCHRVINNNGTIGGYNAGIKRKQWLLNLEKNHTMSH